MRTEQQIFDELTTLCSSPGYVHAVAHICFRDNIIRHSGEMKAEDLHRISSMERLLRTEISTLIGLMIKAPIDYSMPNPQVMQEYVDRTDRLMHELHQAMSAASFKIHEWKKFVDEGRDPFQDGEAFREPIFYSGESAYTFQYRDFAPLKYHADNAWLEQNKGFDIRAAQMVVSAICQVHERKVPERLVEMQSLPPAEWTVVPAFEFTLGEIAAQSGLDEVLVGNVLSAFTLPADSRNDAFNSLHDFNVANALPLLQRNEHAFLSFQVYSLVEALYESPFYWMMADKLYRGIATKNRGCFTEEFAKDCLERVFGKEYVFANVDVYESKGKKLSEIDVLVVFANRAIILQAKSKRLTIEARKGNDQVLKDDFKKSVQESYDQGHLCASVLSDTAHKFVAPTGKELHFSRDFKEVYILSVVSDNYPALSFQTRQFLKHQETEVIKAPFVLDVFTLDAVSEMLRSPLRFLSYLNRRTSIADSVLASQELTILSYHLKKNLWIDDDLTMLSLDDTIAADLDVAMAARREGIPGKKTPEGILTRFAGTTLWRLIEDIETQANPGMIDLGFLLLAISGDAFKDANKLIDMAAMKTRRDGETHDVTLLFGDIGFTTHISDGTVNEAMPALQRHCERRKYTQKVNTWVGVCLDSVDVRLRFGLSLNYTWKQDPSLDELTKDLPVPSASMPDLLSKQRSVVKIGRNAPCPCGSGRKHKKCCL